MHLTCSGNTANWGTHPSPKGGTVRAHTIALLTGVILSVSGFIPESTLAQNAVKPIGKVVTAAGSVTIERVNAVVVQVALGNQPGQAKIGDPIYLGDASQPERTVGLALHLRMARHLICPAMLT